MPATIRCPICKKKIAFNDPNMPFCSDRCRLIDLGNWAAEKYVISSPTTPNELEQPEENTEQSEGNSQ